jgi:hypothetical protein
MTEEGATRALLLAGVLAGPVYIVVAGAQAFTREGFDFRRHAVSLLANGDLGWIQVANFLITGLLVVAFAIGLRQALRGASISRWAAILVGVFGVGVFVAGIFPADPADGFPPGTPPGMPETISTAGALHLAAASIAFVALIAACFVFARWFARAAQGAWAAYSAATGAFFLAAWIALIATEAESAAANVAFAAAITLGWIWLAAIAWRQLPRRAA